MNSHQQYKNDKQIFFRCIFNGDAEGLAHCMDDNPKYSDWIVGGIVKAAKQQSFGCLSVLVDAPGIALYSEWDIRNCLETVLFNSETKGSEQAIAIMLPLIDAYNMQMVAKEALRRAVDYRYPNSVGVVRILLPYSDREQCKDLFLSAVRAADVGVVEYLANILPLKLGYERDEDHVDLLDYLKLAQWPQHFYMTGDPQQDANNQHLQLTKKKDVLEILLRTVDPEILAHRLLTEPNQNDYDDGKENNAWLHEWIDQQRLRTSLNNAVGESAPLHRKRKV